MAPLSGLHRAFPFPLWTDRKAVAGFSGAYLVGPGKYRVDLLIIEDDNRSCRRTWTIEAKLSGRTAGIRAGLPAGAVDELSLKLWGRRVQPVKHGGAYDIALLVHAAPLQLGGASVRPGDRMVLMSALLSLLENLPLRTVRLTLFSLDLQREVHHTPALTPASFRAAAEALERLETGLVDHAVLRNPSGYLRLVSELLHRESAVTPRPDGIIILGPVARWTDVPMVRDAKTYTGLVHYVQLSPYDSAGARMHTHQLGAEQRIESAMPPPVPRPDTLQHFVRRLAGNTTQVRGPEDLAAAIRAIEAGLKSHSTRDQRITQ